MVEKNKVQIQVIIMSLLIAILMCGCGTNRKHNGTYYPDFAEMKTNLSKEGYSITDATSTSEDGETISYINASKEDAFIEFYWLNNDAQVEYHRDELEQSGKSYDRLISMSGDEKFGSFVCAGTKQALDDAGIQIVE